MIIHRRHDLVTESIEHGSRHGLRDKVRRSRECIREAIDRNVGVLGMAGAKAERGVSWRDKIDMEAPDMDGRQSDATGGGTIDGEEVFRRSSRRSEPDTEGRRDQTVGVTQICRGNAKRDRRRVGSARPIDHRGTVQRENAHAGKGGGIGKRVDR